MRDSRKKTVVHVICSFSRGGAERIVLDLCRRIDQSRFVMAVASVMGTGPLYADFEEAGVALCVGGRLPGRPGARSLLRLRRFMAVTRADIVHTHLFAGDVWGVLAARTLHPRPPLLSTEHNINREEGPHHRLLKRQVAPHFSRIIAVSESVRRNAIEREGLPADRLTVIPNGVDLDRFLTSRGAVPGPGTRLVAVGRLVPQKGLDLLLRALVLLPQAHLTLVGEGPERRSLERFVEAKGLGHRVTFAGDQQDVRPFLRDADVLVQPSRWEGFGLSVLEAMAAGLPIVASEVDGLRDLVTSGENGLLVPSGAVEPLASTLRDLMAQPDLRLRMGIRSQERAREFSLEAMATAYASLYDTILTGQDHPPL